MALVVAIGLALWYVYASRASALPAESSTLDGEYRITVRSPTVSPAMMEPSRFVVEITDQSGLPVQAEQLALKYWMPNMFCGMFTADIAEADASHAYLATVIPVMTGKWVLEGKITVGDREVVVRHPFEVDRHS
nr:FixH family protein [Cohnella hashimotonis]